MQQCIQNTYDLPGCDIVNILNAKGTIKNVNGEHYCFYDFGNNVSYTDMRGCLEGSNNFKKCKDSIKSKTNFTDEQVWNTVFYNEILPKRTNTFPGGFLDNDDTTCIVPDKYLKNPPEKVDKPSNPPPATPPAPYIDPSVNLNNILFNIFNNGNFDISEYKNNLKYLENIQPADIKNIVSSYIQSVKTNNSYKDARQNIIKIFNTLNNNKDVINLTVNFSVDIINDLQYLFNEINQQMDLSDSQKFSLDVNNLKNNLVAKLQNSKESPYTDSKNNNCTTFSTESIIIISILTFLLILFVLLWVFKK